MLYQQTATQCLVRIIALQGLSPATRAQCQALRAEAGRLWTDLVTQHAQARAQGQWPSAGDLERARVDSMPCTASACRLSVRNSPPMWRRPPSCGGGR